MKKHVLPLALAFILLLGMLPGTVFAGDDHACETLLDGAYWKLFGKVGYPKLMTEFTGNLYNPYEDDFIPWDIDSDYADTNVIAYMRGLLGESYDEVELTIVNVVKDLFYYDEDEDDEEEEERPRRKKGKSKDWQSKNFLDDDDLEFEFLDLK